MAALHEGEYRTLTFVVRVGEMDQDDEDRLIEDPTYVLTQDEIMFWGQEHGISDTALELGADPDLWHDEDEDSETHIQSLIRSIEEVTGAEEWDSSSEADERVDSLLQQALPYLRSLAEETEEEPDV